MLRAVLFDLDGTLIESADAIVDSMWHVFDTIGEPRPTRQAIIDSIGCPLREQLQILTQHDPDACIAVYRPHYAATACAKTALLPGVREILAAVQGAGLRIGLVTSKKREAAEQILEYHGILDYFEVRIGPHDVEKPKPHPEPLLKAAGLLGLPVESVYYVGDMHFDILAARAAGMPCIALTTGFGDAGQLRDLAPEVVLESLDAARDYILARAG